MFLILKYKKTSFVLLVIFVFLLFYPLIDTSLGKPTLITQFNTLSDKIFLNEKIVMNTTISNPTDLYITDLNIDMIAPNFIVEHNPSWPKTLYPFSYIHGFYVLKPLKIGDSKIWLLSNYVINDTNMQYQESLVSKPATININQSFGLQFSEYVNGVIITLITTTIGAILGALLPEIYKSINKKNEFEREREKTIGNIKNSLAKELKENIKRVNESSKITQNEWKNIYEEHLSLLIEQEFPLEDIEKLYQQLVEYDRENFESRMYDQQKVNYVEQIKSAITTLKDWKKQK